MRYAFDDFTFDTDRFALLRAGSEIELRPRALKVLNYLLENRNRLVTKSELVNAVWGARYVTDTALTVTLKALRQGLGETGRKPRLIKTIYGEGFRFVGEVRELDAPAPAAASSIVPVTAADPLATLDDWIGSRPKVAVVPLRQIGEPGPHSVLTEALPADITHAIAKLPWLFVIERGSAFRFGWEEESYSEARNTLGVQYVVAGSVEVVGDKLYCDIELVDTANHGMLWSDRYVGSVHDIHDIRRDIVGRIIAALEVKIPQHEVRGLDLSMPDKLSAWQAYHAGMSLLFGRTRHDFAQIVSLFDRAIGISPEFGLPWQNKAVAYLWQTLNQQDPDRHSELMIQAIDRAQELDPNDPGCLATAGFVRAVNSEPERGSQYLIRALDQSPNMARAYIARGAIEAHSGDPDEALQSAERAIALSPLDPIVYVNHSSRAAAFLRKGEFDNAADEAMRMETYGHDNLQARILALSALHTAGREAEAERVETRVREMRGRVSSDRMRKQYPKIDSGLAGIIFKTLMDRKLQLA